MPEFEEEEELLEEEEEGQASEMYEHHRIEADNGQNLLRVDKFLMSRLPNASRTKIQEAADAGNILVNGKAVKSSYKVKPKDIVSVVMAIPSGNRDHTGKYPPEHRLRRRRPDGSQ